MNKKIKTMLAVALAVMMMSMTVCAEEANVNARFNNVSLASLTINFDKNNTVYCTLNVSGYAHLTGVSGLMKLFDSSGNRVAIWAVSDYDLPVLVENTYQGKYGETYTVTFGGYAYSNNQTAADRLDLSITGTCKD